MVERAALEMRCTGNCTGGSNPSLSAESSENSLLFLFLVDTVCNPTTSSATATPFKTLSLRADKNSSVGGVKQENYPNKKDPQDFAGRVVK